MSLLRFRAPEQNQSCVESTGYLTSRVAVVGSQSPICPSLSSRKHYLFGRERTVKYGVGKGKQGKNKAARRQLSPNTPGQYLYQSLSQSDVDFQCHLLKIIITKEKDKRMKI